MASLMQLTQLLNFMLLFSFSVLALEDFTNSWVVELDPDVTETEVNDIAKAAGFINYGKVFKDKSLYEFHHPRVAKRSLGHSQYHTDNLQGHTKIRSVEQLVAKTRVKRYADLDSIFPMRDPLWQDTWYLNQAVTNDSLFDMNVMSAWERGFTGSNVVVSILDDGLEHTHPDLAENYVSY
ncbi:FURIN [Bugula neritina]|uniref:FURIN n=1 Tax=Bugula neritina TaxID=10212 RepID=A0A7J7JMY1_BUGNE|nr:FURIN [Bugula neritina]